MGSVKRKPPARRHRTREKKAGKRLEILRRASEAFRRNGIGRTSMQDIADSVGLTAGSLYYYFKSKPDIIYASQQVAIERSLAEALRQQRKRMRPDTRLFLLLHNHLRCLLSDPSASSLQPGTLEILNARQRRQLLESRTRYRRILARVIQNGVAKRLFRKCDPELRAGLIVCLADSLGQGAPDAETVTPEDLAEEMAEYLVRGLMRPKVAIRLQPPSPRRHAPRRRSRPGAPAHFR